MKRIAFAAVAGTLMSAGAAIAMQPIDFDINGDNFVTIGEIRQIVSGFRSSDFRALDTNDDRRLSNNELIAPGVAGILGKYTGSMNVVHGLSEVDGNGDRFATKDELRAVYGGLTDSEFRTIDTNRDNRVSASELYAPRAQALVTRYEMGGSMVVTIMQVDTNDDFFVTFEELSRSFPGLTHLDFEMIDSNGDNRVASQEYYAPEAQSIFDRN